MKEMKHAFGIELPGAHVVGEIDGDDLLEDSRRQFWREHRKHQFDPAEEVSRHPVGARQIDLRVVVGAEDIDATVFEETSHEASHLDVLADPGDAGAQATDTADEELHLDACLGGAVERLDHALLH